MIRDQAIILSSIRSTWDWFSRQHIEIAVDILIQADEERLDELNSILRQVLNDRVVLPLRLDLSILDEPQVLDCGSGKGAWIDDLLEEYEDCDVSHNH